ncbi:MAG: hypothetical protein J6Y72_08040 [Bacteroidales bacterium]|nr:hypothetical protein [Bacteroidales bacterium]
MNKYILTLIATVALSVNAMSQVLTVWKNNLDVYNVETSYIDSVTFNKKSISGEAANVVDLGLPSGLLWRSLNLGATSRTDAGDYFAWGETEGKTSFADSNTKYYTADGYTKYNATDGKTTLEAADDAARAALGGNWRTPTSNDWEELFYNCTYNYITEDGVTLLQLTSWKNSNTIYLPVAGYCLGGEYTNVGTKGDYWTSSLNTDNTKQARSAHFERPGNTVNTSSSYNHSRYLGCTIRPVCTSVVDDADTEYAYFVQIWKKGVVIYEINIDEVDNITFRDGSLSDDPNTDPNPTPNPESDDDEYEYVDLGLPSGLLWASCNLGASEPDQCGSYFAWGETTAKSSFSRSSYKYYDSNTSDYTKYDKATTTLDATDDAATAIMGGKWRMPTMDDWYELSGSCDWAWITLDDGRKAYKITGTNGKYIILPTAGWYSGSSLSYKNECGSYWASELSTSYSDKAKTMHFEDDSQSKFMQRNFDRYEGHSIRPVRQK